jgi:hypothetical protein
MEHVYRDLCESFRSVPEVELHRGDSLEALTGFPDGSLDTAYLDSSHEYQATLSELDLLSSKVRPCGWLMGNDYVPGCPVLAAVDESCRRTGHRISWLTHNDRHPSFAIMIRPNTCVAECR